MLFVVLCAYGLMHASCPDDVSIVESESAAAGFEVCGLDVNGGCATGGEFIEAGAAPFAACGALFTGDVDAYRFTMEERAHVSVSIDAAFGARVVLMSSDVCDEQFTLIDLTHAGGEATEAGGVVNAGVYEVRVMAGDGEVVDCGEYMVRVGVEGHHACCACHQFDTSLSGCTLVTELECHALGGVFCVDNPCEQAPLEIDAFLDPDTLLPEPRFYLSLEDRPFSSTLDLRDGRTTVITISGPESDLIDGLSGEPMEVPFRHFGELRRRIAISSEGRITFPVSDVEPVASTPNDDIASLDFIAPYWTNLDLSSGGTIRILPIGSVPFRALIIEFDGVPLASNTEALVTFQVILFESYRLDAVRFAYRSIPLNHEGVTIGLSSPDGSEFVGVPERLLSQFDTASLKPDSSYNVDFIQFIIDDCDDSVCTLAGDVVCEGDCHANGVIDFDDLRVMLFNYGSSFCSPCDVNNDLFVDFNDLVAALFRFGPCE